ncbi:hypothetical protein D3C75_1107830 [compost metagenome]
MIRLRQPDEVPDGPGYDVAFAFKVGPLIGGLRLQYSGDIPAHIGLFRNHKGFQWSKSFHGRVGVRPVEPQQAFYDIRGNKQNKEQPKHLVGYNNRQVGA